MDASAFWNVIGEYNAATLGLQIALKELNIPTFDLCVKIFYTFT